MRLRVDDLDQVDGGFGLDDEEGVGVGAAGGAEFLAGFLEGVGEDGEDHAAVSAADEVEAALLLDELELGGHLKRAALRARQRRRRKAAATSTLAGARRPSGATTRKTDPSSRCQRRNAHSG